MTWDDVRKYFPNTWVVVEGLRSRAEGDKRVLEEIAVIQCCDSGSAAMEVCGEVQRRYGERMLIFFHTSREQVEFTMTYQFSPRIPARYETSSSRQPALHLSDADISDKTLNA